MARKVRGCSLKKGTTRQLYARKFKRINSKLESDWYRIE